MMRMLVSDGACGFGCGDGKDGDRDRLLLVTAGVSHTPRDRSAD